MSIEGWLTPIDAPAPAQNRPSAATLAEALAQSPDALLALVRELPMASRERTISIALGRAIADTVREEAAPLIREILRVEAPAKVASALTAACARYQWGPSRCGTLADEVRSMLHTAVAEQLAKRAAELTRGLIERIRIEVAP